MRQPAILPTLALNLHQLGATNTTRKNFHQDVATLQNGATYFNHLKPLSREAKNRSTPCVRSFTLVHFGILAAEAVSLVSGANVNSVCKAQLEMPSRASTHSNHVGGLFRRGIDSVLWIKRPHAKLIKAICFICATKAPCRRLD